MISDQDLGFSERSGSNAASSCNVLVTLGILMRRIPPASVSAFGNVVAGG